MECKRCGQCCILVGSTFWTCGDFEKYPKLQKEKDTVELGFNNGMPCQMLIVRNGKAWCEIELIYDQQAKPRICREYPDGELCRHEKL